MTSPAIVKANFAHFDLFFRLFTSTFDNRDNLTQQERLEITPRELGAYDTIKSPDPARALRSASSTDYPD